MLGLGKLGVVRDIEGTATRRGRDGLDPRPADLVAAPPPLTLSLGLSGVGNWTMD